MCLWDFCVQNFLLIMVHNAKGLENNALVRPLCLDKIGAIKRNIFPIIILKATQHDLNSYSPFPQRLTV